MNYIVAIAVLLTLGTITVLDAADNKTILHKINNPKSSTVTDNRYINGTVAAFRADIDSISDMKKGGLLVLDHLDGIKYRLMVVNKQYFKNRIMIDFQCKEMDIECKASMTINLTDTTMYLFSSKASYEMEARNDIAYFYRIANPAIK